VTRLKDAFTTIEGSGEVNVEQFGEVVDTLKVQATALDRLLLFDFVDQKSASVINYMQFYNLIKGNVEKFGECTASDLVLNLAMEHSMSKRGRQVRMDFKKRSTKSNEPRLQPAPIQVKATSLPVSKKASPVPHIRKVDEQKNNVANTVLKETPRTKSHRRQSNPEMGIPEKTGSSDHGYMRRDEGSHENPRRRQSNPEMGIPEKTGNRDHEYKRRNGGSDENPCRNMENTRLSEFVDLDFNGDLIDDENRLSVLRFDSVMSEDMVRQDYSSKNKESQRRRRNRRSQGTQKSDSRRIKSLMKNYRRAISETIQQQLSTDRRLLKELKQIALIPPETTPGKDSNVDSVKEETQRSIKRLLEADFGKLDGEISETWKELTGVLNCVDPQSGEEVQRTLWSVKQTLSNIEDHMAFNMGAKVDHLESKLNKILTLLSKDKQTNIEPQSESEIRDERKRLREAMKFIESLVKKFKHQKADYKNHIRLASEKIRKERKHLAREKERLKKKTAVIEEQKNDIKKRTREISRAERKIIKRTGSGVLTPVDSNQLARQTEEIEKMKETVAKQDQQLLAMRNKLKEDRKKFQNTLNEMKKKNRYLENVKIDLQNDVANTENGRENGARKRKALAMQVAELSREREELIKQKGAMKEAEQQSKETLDKERKYLANMKDKLQELAQQLSEERNNNEAAQKIDMKAKSIATYMQQLADERETLYIEREKFEAERNTVLAVWAEKEKELKKLDQVVQKNAR